MYENFLHKTVLIRSVSAGVYYGTLEEVSGMTVRVSKVRNIWSWEGASCLSQLANEGIRGGKVSQEVSEIILTDACEILPLTEIAILSLNKIPAWRV